MLNNQRIGGFFPINIHGDILNPTSADLISPILRPIINEIILLYREFVGEDLHSLWLRGSVPRGFYTEKYSDLDVYALVNSPNIRWQKASWANEAEEKLKKKYELVPDIEWAISSWYPDFYQRNPRLSFYLKTQSLLLYGQNVCSDFPNFKITDDIKMNITWLKEDFENFMQIEEPNKHEIQTILKVVIRSAFESIMEQEGRYTPDLYWCADAFSRHNKEGEELIFDLLNAFEIENNNIFYLKENIEKVVKIII